MLIWAQKLEGASGGAGINRGGGRPELKEAESGRRCGALELDSGREEGERKVAKPMEGSGRLGGRRSSAAGGGLLRPRVCSGERTEKGAERKEKPGKGVLRGR